MKKFEIGSAYVTDSIINNDFTIWIKVVDRTACTIKVQAYGAETISTYRINKKLSAINDAETISYREGTAAINGINNLTPIISALDITSGSF